VASNAGIVTSNSHTLTSKRKIDERRNIAHHDGASSSTIIPIILTSDKTLLSHNAKVKAWPLFMTIGNISNKVRFVPGKHCAQLICMIPVKFGFYTVFECC
jgi:Plavaka transposase